MYNQLSSSELKRGSVRAISTVLLIGAVVVIGGLGATASGGSSAAATTALSDSSTTAHNAEHTSTPASAAVDAEIIDVQHELFLHADDVGTRVTKADITVRNTGDTAHDFTVGVRFIDPTGEEHEARHPETISLDPDEESTVTVYWYADYRTLPDVNPAPAGNYDAVAIVYEGSDPGDNSTPLDTAEQDNVFRLPELPDLTVASLDAPAEAAPGEEITIEVTIANNGGITGRYPYYVEFAGDPVEDLPLSLGADETETKTYTVTAPEEPGEYTISAHFGGEKTTTLTVTDDAGDSDHEIDAEITAVDVQGGEVTHDDTVAADITIHNTGTTEQEFYVDYNVIAPGEDAPNPQNVGGEDGATALLAPGEEATVTVEWEIDDAAQTGVYDIYIGVYDQDPQADITVPRAEATLTDAFELVETAPTRDAEIVDVTVPVSNVDTGDDVPADITIQNTGDTEHTFAVGYSVVDPTGEHRHNDGGTWETVTLASGETSTVTAVWQVEDDAPTGDYDAIVAVYEESDPADATTQLDDQSMSDAFHVTQPDAPAQFEVTDTTIISDTGDDSEEYTVEATIANTGDQTGTFTAELIVNGEVVNAQNVTIAGDSTETVVFQVAFDEPDSYEISVSNTSAGTITITESDADEDDVEIEQTDDDDMDVADDDDATGDQDEDDDGSETATDNDSQTEADDDETNATDDADSPEEAAADDPQEADDDTNDDSAPGDEDQPGFGVGIALVAIAALLVIAARRHTI